MARGKKLELVNGQDEGIFKFIKLNTDIIDDSKRIPNYHLDEYAAVCVDANENHELFKIKQVTVTSENIKSTTTQYGDKYKIGDTYQEWISMEKYLDSPLEAAKCYAKMIGNNEISKLAYCKDINKLVEISNKINKTLEEFAINYTVPEVTKQLSKAHDALINIQKEIKAYEDTKLQITSECNELLELIRNNRKIIVDNMPKEKKHRIKLEEN
jgi:hypothetical protein